MNAHTPPSFCASARTWYTSVVLPEDSGPKTSTMRPRGMPPMPSARSSDSAPVGMALTLTWAPSSPIRMTLPLPNWRSICVSAPCSASLRAFAAFSSVTGMGGEGLSSRSGSTAKSAGCIGRNEDATDGLATTRHDGVTSLRHGSDNSCALDHQRTNHPGGASSHKARLPGLAARATKDVTAPGGALLQASPCERFVARRRTGVRAIQRERLQREGGARHPRQRDIAGADARAPAYARHA